MLYFKIKPQDHIPAEHQTSTGLLAQAFFAAQTDTMPLDDYLRAIETHPTHLWLREEGYIVLEGSNVRLTLDGRHFLFYDSPEQAARRMQKRLELDLETLAMVAPPELDDQTVAGTPEHSEWYTVYGARYLMQQALKGLQERPRQCSNCGKLGWVCCADGDRTVCTDCCPPHLAEPNPGSGYFVTGSR